MLLPQPGNDSITYLFHLSLNGFSSPIPYPIYDDTVYMTPQVRLFGFLSTSKINQKGNNGLGAAIEMNEVLNPNDTAVINMLTACRHANGRDWWILLPKLDDNLYYTYLLSPTGLELIHRQRIGAKICSGIGQSCFSPDGTKYIRADVISLGLPNYYYNLYDFDRCTGRLSNHIFMKKAIGPQIGWSPAAAFSASSRYLYLGAYDEIFQYDLEAPNWQSSEVSVGQWDGFYRPVPPNDSLSVGFDELQLAPDGKIYGSSGANGGSPYLHVIHAPDSPGIDCHFQQRAITLQKYTASNLPYHPNYRLGPLDGSPCDTLGINVVAIEQPQQKKQNLTLYPNPSTDKVTMAWEKGIEWGAIRVYSALGVLEKEILRPSHLSIEQGKWDIDVDDWGQGLHIFHLFDAQNQLLKTLFFIKI
jgi:hypothetical protein